MAAYNAQTRHLYSELFTRAEANVSNKLAAELVDVLAKHPQTAAVVKPQEK